MSKNVVLMVVIEDPNHKFPPFEYAQVAADTWARWCFKNNIDFGLIDKRVQQYERAKWNKLCVFDVIKPEHEKIALVDADTVIKWDAPNFFELYDGEFCGVVDDGNIDWIKRSIEIYKPFFNIDITPEKYINSGVMFFSRNHEYFFNQLKLFYDMNVINLDSFPNRGGGTDQTIINFMLKAAKIDIKLLDKKWNFLGHNWVNKDENILNYDAHIIHYTGIPLESRIKLMKYYWKEYGFKYDV